MLYQLIHSLRPPGGPHITVESHLPILTEAVAGGSVELRPCSLPAHVHLLRHAESAVGELKNCLGWRWVLGEVGFTFVEPGMNMLEDDVCHVPMVSGFLRHVWGGGIRGVQGMYSVEPGLVE